MSNSSKIENTPISSEQFEKAMSRLEEIIRILERGELGLDESIRIFREGSELYRMCREKLTSAEGEIKMLLEGLDGSIIEKPFEQSSK